MMRFTSLDLPAKNKTDDDVINTISMAENRIVISKDADFYDRFFAKLEPYKLLFLTTGNIRNNDLIDIFENNLSQIIEELNSANVIRLSRTNLTIIA